MGVENPKKRITPEEQKDIDAEVEAAWNLMSPPKTQNLELAKELVALGFVPSLEDIYLPLTEEQKIRLEKLRRIWEKEEQFLTTDFEW